MENQLRFVPPITSKLVSYQLLLVTACTLIHVYSEGRTSSDITLVANSILKNSTPMISCILYYFERSKSKV